MYVYVCMYMYACICMYVYVCMYMYVCMYVCICMCVCMYVCMYRYMCVCIHVCVCMHNILGFGENCPRGEMSYTKWEGIIVRGELSRGELSYTRVDDVASSLPIAAPSSGILFFLPLIILPATSFLSVSYQPRR